MILFYALRIFLSLTGCMRIMKYSLGWVNVLKTLSFDVLAPVVLRLLTSLFKTPAYRIAWLPSTSHPGKSKKASIFLNTSRSD